MGQMNRGWLVLAAVLGAFGLGLMVSRQPASTAPPPPTLPPSLQNAPVAAPTGFKWRPVQGGTPAGQEGAPAPSPRENADGLFNVVMMAAEQRDQTTVANALPQALAAYGALDSIDDDGIFHVATLELTGGRLADARTTAQKLLTKNPNHLLALSVAAKAATGAGDAAAARDFNQRLLKAYDSEVKRPLPEYQDHARVMPLHRAEAEAALKLRD